MPARNRLVFVGGTLITPDGTLSDASLSVDGDTIAAIGGPEPTGDDWTRIDARGLYVAPGFIDVHVHGAAGADFMDGSAADVRRIVAYHAQGGTTALLATTATDSLDHILAAIRTIREAQHRSNDGAKVLGIHLEGPYFNFEKKGCHLPQYVRNPTPAETERLLAESDIVRWVTLAPELPGSEALVRAFVARGIVVSMGHSNADYPQIVRAIEWGVRHSTHLYCAMSSVIKTPPARRGGIVEASLLRDELTTEVIADGVHLPPELMQLAFRCKGPEGLLLVTDAQRAAGMPDGRYEFGRKGEGAPFIVKGGVATTPDRSGYASSTVQMIDTVRVACEQIGATLEEAIMMASRTPARRLGLDVSIGSLEVGKRADLVLFDERWRVHRTYVDGREVYRCS